MKGALSFISLLVVAGVVIPFALPIKDGKPLLNISDIKLPETPDLADISLPEFGSATSSTTMVYQWVDQNGQMQFSNTPPPEGVMFQTKSVDGNVNTIKSVKPLPKRAKPDETQAAAVNFNNPVSLTTANPTKVMKDAKQIEQTLQNRDEEL